MFDAKNFWLYLVNHDYDFDDIPRNLEAFYNFWMFSFKTNLEWLNFKNNRRDLEIADKVFKENMQFKDIASEYGIHKSTVSKICNDFTNTIRDNYDLYKINKIEFFTKEVLKGVWYQDPDNIAMLPISRAISNALRRAGLTSMNEIYNLSGTKLKLIRGIGNEGLKTLIEAISSKIYKGMYMSDYLLTKIDCGVPLTYIDCYNMISHFKLSSEILSYNKNKQNICAVCKLNNRAFKLDYLHYIDSIKLPDFNSQPSELL